MNTLSWGVKLHKRNGNQSQHLKYIFPYTFITITHIICKLPTNAKTANKYVEYSDL